MLSPFAAAAQSLQGPPAGMGNMAMQQPPGQRLAGLAGNALANPFAAQQQGMVTPNANEQPWLASSSAGFLDPVASNNTGNPGMLIDPILLDQIKGGFPPKSETFQQLSPMTYRPDGPFSQIAGGMSLGGQLQAGGPSAGSLGQQLQAAPRSGTMGGASNPLLQALGGR